MIRTARPHLLPSRRRAFTLIELLIVIVIMAILAALTASVVMRFIGVQEKNNTDTLIGKLNPLLQNQWRLVVEKAKKEPLSQEALNLSQDASGVPDEGRARVIHIKLRLRQEFPQTFAEVVGPFQPNTLAPLPTYARALNGLSTTPTVDIQSAICLLLALSQSRGGSPVSPEDLGSSALAQWRDTGTNRSLNYLIDGWQAPLLFIRFPTQDRDLNPVPPGNATPTNPLDFGAQPGLRDTLDPEGRLANASWLSSPNRDTFGTLLHRAPDNPGSPQSFRIFPLIFSSGPNRVMGLDPNTGAIVTGQDSNASDNISSWSLLSDNARGQ